MSSGIVLAGFAIAGPGSGPDNPGLTAVVPIDRSTYIRVVFVYHQLHILDPVGLMPCNVVLKGFDGCSTAPFQLFCGCGGDRRFASSAYFQSAQAQN